MMAPSLRNVARSGSKAITSQKVQNSILCDGESERGEGDVSGKGKGVHNRSGPRVLTLLQEIHTVIKDATKQLSSSFRSLQWFI